MKKTTAPAAGDARPRSVILAAEIEAKRQQQRDAAVELDRLKAARLGMLRTATDDALEAHDRAMAKASRAIERAAALEGDLLPQLAKAKAEEEQDRRAAIYARGRAAIVAYRQLLESGYAPLAEKVAAVLREAREQLDIVRAANAELPAGKAPLDADDFRHGPAPSTDPPPAEIEGLRWVDKQGLSCRPLLTEKAGRMVPDIDGAHQVPCMVPNPARAGWRPPVRKTAPPLLSTVRLPGVTVSDQPLWS